MAVAPCLSAKPDHAVLSPLRGFAFAELSLGSERGAPAITLPQHRSSGTPLLWAAFVQNREGDGFVHSGKILCHFQTTGPTTDDAGGIQSPWQQFYI